MHKVFIDDKPLIIDDIYKKNTIGNENLLILSDSEFTLDKIIKKIDEKKTKGIIYLCARPDQEWNEFTSRYILMEAAGGIVKNNKEEFLLIYRRKYWDLPKGKLDYGESPEEAAIREVKEECGLQNPELGKFVLKTFHTYREKNKSILKKTYWFGMNSENEKLIPQHEEDIEEATWMSKQMIYQIVFQKTYASIIDVFNAYFEITE